MVFEFVLNLLTYQMPLIQLISKFYFKHCTLPLLQEESHYNNFIAILQMVNIIPLLKMPNFS